MRFNPNKTRNLLGLQKHLCKKRFFPLIGEVPTDKKRFFTRPLDMARGPPKTCIGGFWIGEVDRPHRNANLPLERCVGPQKEVNIPL